MSRIQYISYVYNIYYPVILCIDLGIIIGRKRTYLSNFDLPQTLMENLRIYIMTLFLL